MNTLKAESWVILNGLADEIAERYRHGERPTLKEFIERHPELADDIRDLFPALIEMEQIKQDQEAAEVTTPSLAAPPREQLGDFRILRKIGQGGMGVVYEAEQISLGRHVALKVLSRKLPDIDKHRRRFEREAKSAARLHHTNIVPVFGVGEHEGVPYYVMQFIQGLGLDAVLTELMRLHRGPDQDQVAPRTAPDSAYHAACSLLTGELNVEALRPQQRLPSGDITRDCSSDSSLRPGSIPMLESPSAPVVLSASSLQLTGPDSAGRSRGKRTYWHSVARIGVQVADALEYAHRHTVLHRDIKPSNLLLDTAGTIWVTDFGLAKADDSQNLTDTGDILGTLRYMPPEAFEGKADARGDLYSLGLTLYELLALRPAFDEKEQLKLIKQVTHSDPPRLRKINPEIPRDLETIVQKAIDRDPAHRYQTAGEFGADLERFLNDEPIQARRLSLVERLGRWARRNRGIAASLSTIGLLLVLLASGASYAAIHFKEGKEEQTKLAGEKEGERSKAVAARDDAKRGEQREAALRKEAEQREAEKRQELYYAEMNLAGQAAESVSGIGRVSALVDNWGKGAPDLRGWEWFYLNSLTRRDQRTLKGHKGPVQCVVWSPDGKTFASGGTDGKILVWQTGSDRPLLTLDGHKDIVQSIMYRPDSKQLASAGDDGVVRIWDAVTGKEAHTWKMSAGWLQWSADGKRIHAGSAGSFHVWDIQEKRVVQSKRISGDVSTPGVASPDGKRFVVAGYPKTIRVWDMEKNQELFVLKGFTGWLSPIVWRPDGKVIAIANAEGTIKLLDASKGQELASFRGHKNAVSSLAWRPDGKQLLSTSRDGTIRIWDAETRAELSVFRGHTAAVRDAAWSPDGKQIVSASTDGTVKLWEAESSPEVLTLRGHDTGSHALAWSPNSKQLASGGHDGAVRVWSAVGGKPQMLGKHGGLVHAVTWHPDGKRLASCSADATLKIWDMTTGKQLLSWRAHEHEVYSVAWSPNGKWLATGSRDQRLKVWDADKGTLIREIGKREHRGVWVVAWDADSERIVTGRGTGHIGVFAAATGKELHLIEAKGAARTVVWSPDGKRLASAGSPGSGAERQVITHSVGSSMVIWNALTGEKMQVLQGHFEAVRAMAWSPDGKRLLTGSDDATVKVWDPITGRETLTLRGHTDEVRSVVWSPDGKKIASAGADKVILIHDATRGHGEPKP